MYLSANLELSWRHWSFCRSTFSYGCRLALYDWWVLLTCSQQNTHKCSPTIGRWAAHLHPWRHLLLLEVVWNIRRSYQTKSKALCWVGSARPSAWRFSVEWRSLHQLRSNYLEYGVGPQVSAWRVWCSSNNRMVVRPVWPYWN